MEINFINHTEKNIIEYSELISSIFKTVDDKREFTIIFVDNDEIQQINKQYRGIDSITDVISFAMLDNDDSNYNALDELGDIFICLDRAIEQAAEYEHSVEREVGFLAVHGYLHLCGYDHMEESDEKEMIAKQKEILNNAKLYRE